MAQQFKRMQWVPFPVELVFAFFANPANLPHLMPPVLDTRIEDVRMEAPPPRPVAQDPSRRFLSVAAGVGSEIMISFCPFPGVPSRVSWMARITEFAWNSHFCDEQVRGPFKYFRHRHGIVAEAREGQEGTLVTDEIEFEMKYGLIGRIGELVARGRLKSSFAYRQLRLPVILGAAMKQAGRRA